MIEQFDLVVVGSGPAGEKAATQAASFGKRVAIVEQARALGGVAVTRVGMIPTKTLRETALYVTGYRKRDLYGVSIELDARSVHRKLGERTDEVAETMTQAVSRGIVRHRIELVRGAARLGADRTVYASAPGRDERVLRGEAVLIATGSSPYHPPGVPFEDPDVHDSEDVLEMEEPPAAMIVVGGGAVAVEHASIFTALGTKVTLVDPAERLLPYADQELSALLAKTFEQMGMRVRLGTKVGAVTRDDEGLTVVVGARPERTEKILFAFGRSGNTSSLGLSELGIETDRRGCIVVDDRYRTTAPGVYAAGDVIGPPALASVAMEQGRVVACHAFGVGLRTVVDELAPIGIYSIPEVAGVGLTEQDARRDGVDYEVGRGRFALNPRATISGATEGMVKLIFGRRDLKLLGAHILGDAATEIIHVGQSAIAHGDTIEYFVRATFNVPTMCEAYKTAAYDGLLRRGSI